MPWYGIIIHNIFNIHITRFYGFFILKLPLSVPMSVFMLVKQTVDPFKTLIFYPPNVFSPPFWQTLNSLCILSLFLTLKETKKNLFPLLLYFLFMTKLSAPKCIAVAIHCSQIVLFTAELLSSVVGSITCNWRHCFKTLFIASWERRETLGWNCVSHTHGGWIWNGWQKRRQSTCERESCMKPSCTPSYNHVWHSNWNSLTRCDHIMGTCIECV